MDGAATLGQSHDEYPRIEQAFQQFLDASLDPRGPDSLFEMLGALDLPSDGVAVDVGCGDGGNALQLAKRFGLRVVGVDPVRRHIELSAEAAEAEGLAGAVEFKLGSAESIPLDDSSADLVWCKEVLMYTDLRRAFREFSRVLRPNGIGFVHQVFTGPRMSDEEAREFWAAGGAQSVRPSDIEAAISSAGLVLRGRTDYGSEWGEFAQERDGAGGRRLLHAARLLRDPGR